MAASCNQSSMRVPVKGFPRRRVFAIHMLLCVLALHTAPVSAAGAAKVKSLPMLWEFKTASDLPQSVIGDSRGNGIWYLAQKERGLAILKHGRRKDVPRVIARIERAKLAGFDAMNLTQAKGLLYVALGDLFAVRGSKAGLAVVDVRMPHKPKVLSVWTSRKTLGGSAGVAVAAGYAYLGAMEHGVFILDVRVPEKVGEVTLFQPDVDFPTPNPGRTRHPSARAGGRW